jgi:hypothetical protein
MNRKVMNLLLIVLVMLSACGDKTVTIENMLKEWTGKTIYFPNIKPALLKKTDIVRENKNSYKILNYVDSTGCTGCKLGMDKWKLYIQEMDSTINFLFYFHPKNEKELVSLLKREKFVNYPVYIDTNDELNKLNHFPYDPTFHCFLLDKDNKVLAIGNPAKNIKIWELYKKIITGEISDKPPVTTIEPEQIEIELNNLQTGKTSEAIFILKNTGAKPLVIQHIESSCGCTVPEWEKQPIVTGNSTEITVKITPEKSEYFNKTITVHCNIETGQISLIVKGTVK